MNIRNWPIAAVTSGLVLVIYVVSGYLLWPDGLPAPLPWLLGLGCAALAVVTYVLATRRVDSFGRLLRGAQPGRHVDFGKQLRSARSRLSKPRTVNLPGFGQTGVRLLGGIAVFVVVSGWWLSGFAPVRVKEPVVEDLTIPLGEEIVSAVLVLPDSEIAIVAPPVLPPRGRRLAARIKDNAGPYKLGLRAIAQGHFDLARELLGTAEKDDAEKDGSAKPCEIYAARGLNAMYAGRFTEAVKWYDEALKEKPGEVMLLCQAIVARIQARKFREAEKLCEQELKPRQEQLSGDDPVRAACFHVRALLNLCRGKEYGEAEKMCFHAGEDAKRAEKRLRRTHPLLAASLNNQAVLYLLRANYPGAENLNTEAYRIWVKNLGPQHPNPAVSRTNLAILRYELGRYANAAKLLDEVRNSRQQGPPGENPLAPVGQNARALLRLARAQYEQEEQVPLEQSLEQTLASCQQTLGHEHPCVIPIVTTLANVYAAQARYKLAGQHYRRAVRAIEKVWGPDHPFLAGSLNRLARLYLAQKRYDDAEKLCGRALKIARETFGRQHPDVGAVLNTRGRLESERGRPGVARQLLDEALEIRQKTLGKEHPDVARTLGNLAALSNSPSNFFDGVRQYSQAIKMARKLLGEKHPDVARLEFRLGALYLQRGKYAEAKPHLRGALEIQEPLLARWNHPDLAATLEAYASLLRATAPDEPEAADQMQARAEAIRQKHAQENRPE